MKNGNDNHELEQRDWECKGNAAANNTNETDVTKNDAADFNQTIFYNDTSQ